MECEKAFLAIDANVFLNKMRLEMMRYKSCKREEVLARYEFLISSIEAEHLIRVVPEEEYIKSVKSAAERGN